MSKLWVAALQLAAPTIRQLRVIFGWWRRPVRVCFRKQKGQRVTYAARCAQLMCEPSLNHSIGEHYGTRAPER